MLLVRQGIGHESGRELGEFTGAYELDLARQKIGAAIKRIPQRKQCQPSETSPQK
jgi:hypothetical protein